MPITTGQDQLRALETRVARIERELDLEFRRPWPDAGPHAFGKSSLLHMRGVHCDLQAVAYYALRICKYDFGVPRTGGVRTQAMQEDLVRRKKSKTMNSRHLTGHALDIYAYVGGAASWHPPIIMEIHAAFVKAGHALQVPLRWGGDWDGDGVHEWNENDLVHHECPRQFYADSMESRSTSAQEFLRHIGLARLIVA